MHAGGNAVTVDNVSLNLTDTGQLMAAARASAVADAQGPGQPVRRRPDEQLGPVISITPGQQASPVFTAMPSPTHCRRQQAARVPISPGTQQLSVSITVVYSA